MSRQRLVGQDRADGGDVTPLISWHLLDFLKSFQKCESGHDVSPVLFGSMLIKALDRSFVSGAI
jgi:hypothetical protein